MNTPKRLLRRQMRIQRQSIGENIQQIHAGTAANFLEQLPCFEYARHIAIYHPFDSEMPTNKIADLIWKSKKQCYLPVVMPVSSQLSFAPFQENSRLVKNKFGILEPDYTANELRAADQLDLVIAPLVAFDKQGHRVGMGGGYYDKTFGFLKRTEVKKPLIIGLAYSFQEQEDLTIEPWDIPLFAVITEKQVHQYSRRAETKSPSHGVNKT